ncbi:hypothetical protein ABH927_005286 [Planotetraspora sp. GP83]
MEHGARADARPLNRPPHKLIATEAIYPSRLAQPLLGQTTDQEELHGNA